MTINERILKLITELNISSGEFAEKLNIQRSSISHLTSGRNKPSVDFLEKLLNIFPNVNVDWLIVGSGSMFKTENDNSGIKTNPTPTLFSDYEEVTTKKNEIKTNIPINNKEKSVLKSVIPPQNQTKKLIKVILTYSDGSFESFEN